METIKRTRGEVKDAQAAQKYLMNSMWFGPKRDPRNQHDFGDNATIGVHLKRIGISFHDYQDELDFALFLGAQDDGYVVAIKNMDASDIVGAEVFETLEQLKQVWELD